MVMGTSNLVVVQQVIISLDGGGMGREMVPGHAVVVWLVKDY